MHAMTETQLADHDIDSYRSGNEWEQLQERWHEASSQYHDRAISERELTKRISVVLNMQLDLLRNCERRTTRAATQRRIGRPKTDVNARADVARSSA